MKFLSWGANRSKGKQSRRSAGEWIAWAAVSIADTDTFRQRAAEAASTLGVRVIPSLPKFFHDSPPEPPEAEGQFPGLGDWMAACQFAIFEILYNFREASLPLLREVAFGEYDWTQANAIEILCRFGVEGIERETIAEELAADFPNWRDEALSYTINALTQFAPYAPPVMAALDNLIAEWSDDDPIPALEYIEPLVRNAPEAAKQYEPLLRQVMREEGRDPRNPLLDGQVVEREGDGGEKVLVAMSGPEYPSVLDYHAIKAALMLVDLFPADAEALSDLREWAQNHPDEQVRSELQNRLNTGGSD